jgi:NAD(P)-dependent dehydrogenase (short-subunit alcohol dehydrogenase family)
MFGVEGAPMDLSGRVAVVTGAGTGIGRAIALELSRLGASVGLVGRTRASLEAVAGEAKGETCVITADVRERPAVEAAFDAIQARIGGLHAVIANAGVGGPNDLGGVDRWDEIVRTNLDGAYFTLRSFERRLAPGDGFRHAIVISSCVARFGVPGISAYSAAKTGQLGLVRSLAVELAAKRVLVNAICPGWVDTQMAADRMSEIGEGMGKGYDATRRELLASVPLQRISEPEEIAGLVAFLLSPAAVGFTGQAFDPNNGAWMG